MSNPIQLVYFVIGDNLANFQQVTFSIASFLPQLDPSDQVIVVTDHPEYLKLFDGKIQCIQKNENELKEWKGPYQFFWRIKIKLLQSIAELNPKSDILYLDSDTFLYGNLNDIRTIFHEQKNVMHCNEGQLHSLNSKTEKLMWDQVKNKTYQKIQINNASCMWNAGVVGIPSVNSHLLKTALEICDEMCSQEVTRRLIEQFALSLALSDQNNCLSTENIIGHYWATKKHWGEKIQALLLQNYLQQGGLDQLVGTVLDFDKTSLPIYSKTSNTRHRLMKLLEKIFPEKNLKYLFKN